MNYLDQLDNLINKTEFIWCTNAEAWGSLDFAIQSLLPPSYRQVLNRFGHGAWGGAITLLHPLAKRWEQLTPDNLRETHRLICEMEDIYPKRSLMEWRFFPLSCLHDTCCLVWLPDDQEIAVYDVDYNTFSKSGIADLAEFLVCMIANENVTDELRDWRDDFFESSEAFVPVDPKAGITVA